jgi:hypothetical protein
MTPTPYQNDSFNKMSGNSHPFTASTKPFSFKESQRIFKGTMTPQAF